MTNETGSINQTSDGFQPSHSPLARLAELHYPRIVWKLLPRAFRDALRETRGRVVAYLAMRQLPRDKVFEQSAEDAEASSVLSIIVPVHDAPEVTERCLKSLERYAPNAEVILVDDGSKLEETRTLLDSFAARNGWMLIRHQTPLGHSGACAAGSGAATKPYLCFLNSDTVVTPWSWRPMVEALNGDPRIGAAGPSSSNGGVQTLNVANITCFKLNDSQICEYARRLFVRSSRMAPIDIPWLCGFALFTRRSFWEQIGGFDPLLVDYGNDYEISRRILESGYRLVWVRSAYIHHFGHTSYKRTLGEKSIHSRTQVAHEYIEQKYMSNRV